MDIDSMTIGEAKRLCDLFGSQRRRETPFKPGEAYLIRTVTMTWTGRVNRVIGDFIVIDNAAWIADTGRFSEAIASGIEKLNEVEPVDGPVFIGLGAIVDAVQWNHVLPREVK